MASYMKDEIFSEPNIVLNSINNNIHLIKEIANEVKSRNINNIATVARGSSDNATLCFKYATEILAGYPVMEFHPSVTTMYKSEIKMKNNLMIAVSQSGKSIDTLAVINNSRKNGALTVAVTNDADSPLAKAAHYHLNISCGEEKSVAATKTFIGELVVLYMLAIALSDKDLYAVIYSLPQKIQSIIDKHEEIKQLAQKISMLDNTIVLSRGIMQGVGNEVSLKYLECCYNLSNFYSVTDFMHGPLAIVDDKTNVLVLAPDSEFRGNFIDIVTRINLLGANITSISDIKDVNDTATNCLTMPKCDMLTSTILYSTACHLLLMEISYARGLNPDSPRNLSKVTITK